MDAEAEKRRRIVVKCICGAAQGTAGGVAEGGEDVVDIVRYQQETNCPECRLRAMEKAGLAELHIKLAEQAAEIERLEGELSDTIRDAREQIREVEADARAMAADLGRMQG